MRLWFLNRSVLFALAMMVAEVSVCAAAPSETPDLNRLIDGVERHYNNARTLAVDFMETYQLGGRTRRPESGSLLLRKPGRMRWSYTDPAGKLFISDGKNVYLYTPSDNRVERSSLKASEDMRAPMAFLLGKLDLKRDFSSFVTQPSSGDTLLIAGAKSDRTPYEKVEMLIARDYAIHQLTIHGRDGSIVSFQFRNEQVNPAASEEAFRFEPPAGVEVVDAINTRSGEN